MLQAGRWRCKGCSRAQKKKSQAWLSAWQGRQGRRGAGWEQDDLGRFGAAVNTHINSGLWDAARLPYGTAGQGKQKGGRSSAGLNIKARRAWAYLALPAPSDGPRWLIGSSLSPPAEAGQLLPAAGCWALPQPSRLQVAWHFKGFSIPFHCNK